MTSLGAMLTLLTSSHSDSSDKRMVFAVTISEVYLTQEVEFM